MEVIQKDEEKVEKLVFLKYLENLQSRSQCNKDVAVGALAPHGHRTTPTAGIRARSMAPSSWSHAKCFDVLSGAPAAAEDECCTSVVPK